MAKTGTKNTCGTCQGTGEKSDGTVCTACGGDGGKKKGK